MLRTEFPQPPHLKFLVLLVLLFCNKPFFAQSVSTLVSQNGVRFEAITWSNSGDIYSLDYYGGNVFLLNSSGSVQTIVTGISGPAGGAIDGQGNFYFSELNQGRIHKVHPDNSHHIFATGLNGPAGIAINPSGDSLFVSNYNNSSISKIALSDSSVTPFVSGQGLNGPDGLSFAPNGDLIVANFNDNRLHRITPSGNVSLFATIANSPNTGYLVRAGTDYYVSGFYSHQIWKVDASGNVSLYAGTGVQGTVDGPLATALFDLPNGIALNPAGDTLIIAEGGTGGHIRVVPDPGAATWIPEADLDVFAMEVFPNPSHDSAKFRVQLNHATKVRLELLSMRGKPVAEIFDGLLPAGEQEIPWLRPADLAAGGYICRLTYGQRSLNQLFILRD